MKSVDENIDSLSRAILHEARGSADQVLEDARASAETIRKQAQERAETERKEILDRAKQEAERIHGQKIAAAQLKARTLQLGAREKMLDKVYKTAMEELPSVQRWTDYEEIARNLLREALSQMRVSEVRIRADSQTMSHYPDSFLVELSREMNIQITRGEPLAKGTGVVVEAVNGRMQYDNTLETRLLRMWNAMRSPVNHILMGETMGESL
jgi:V/A-type H+/Na+-transporting ATPase subunit E